MSPGTGFGMVLGWPKGLYENLNELCGQPYCNIKFMFYYQYYDRFIFFISAIELGFCE